jgi:hypothetical protein
MVRARAREHGATRKERKAPGLGGVEKEKKRGEGKGK